MIKLILVLSSMLLFVVSCNKTNTKVTSKEKSPIITEEFVYEIKNAKTPQCHASTVAESGNIIIAAWFGGTAEKNRDVGIWVSRKLNNNWTEPVEVVNGIQEDGKRFPCWNPVLFQAKDSPLFLFYKVGPNPREWWGLYVTSNDSGKSWSKPVRLPDGIYGPIKNKPIQITNGNILAPTSTEHDGWKVQIETSTDGCKTWSTSGDLNNPEEYGAIQPTILIHNEDTLQILCRTKNGVISQSWSYDRGKIWTKMESLGLPNPNSGIDAVTLKDGRHLLVYNPTDKNWGDRVPLSVAISNDGKVWKEVFELESVTNPATAKDEEYSYPSVIQTTDGLVHIVYTWNRKTVKHVVIDPSLIKS